MNADSTTTIGTGSFGLLRQTMVDSQLRSVGIMDGPLLAAMASVPREAFVPAAWRGLAYSDAAIEVAPGRFLLEPLVLGLLFQTARLAPGQRVLVIGAATGYSAAVAGAAGAAVTALESDAGLAAIARRAGVAIAEGPLAAGWPASAPYDIILFEGAIETVPASIAAQLAADGRLAAVLREGGVGHAMVGPAIIAGDTARIGGLPFLEVAAKLLPGFARARQFAF